MKELIETENFRLTMAVLAFVVLLLAMFFINRMVYKFLKNRAAQTESKFDDFMLDLFKVPGLALVYWITAQIFTHYFFDELTFTSVLDHINSLFIIAIMAWIFLQFVKLGAYYIRTKLDISVSDNLNARRSLTQINVFKNIANTVIVALALAAALMTFEQARGIGVSLLTSAGVLGIIVGLAAQKSIGMILSGIQIAITQPIRLDDVVIVEGEWGRIEEITLTYVVVRIWDERRLVLPVNYFLEKPFQNWTRTSANILGTVFVNVDYNFPVNDLRDELPRMLEGDANWDGRVANVQVTNVTDRSKELRVLLSSADSSKNWSLRVGIREKVVDYIQHNYPDAFVKIRLDGKLSTP
ncbi:MAG: mechanosensitive ion channel [Breznakibacter sp.]